MKAATISEIKQELTNSSPSTLVELCLRLSKFKKENKELLTYLLFEAHDSVAYIQSVKNEIDHYFELINKKNPYYIKKSLRKILRMIYKYVRYSALATIEIELLVYFCTRMKTLEISVENDPVFKNIYQNQLKRVRKAMSSIHEDLQYDYQREIDKLQGDA